MKKVLSLVLVLTLVLGSFSMAFAAEKTESNLSDIEGKYNSGLSELEGNYSSSLADALASYNNAVANAQAQKLAQIIELENALTSNKLNAYTNYHNMMNDYNNDYYNILKSAIANEVNLL